MSKWREYKRRAHAAVYADQLMMAGLYPFQIAAKKTVTYPTIRGRLDDGTAIWAPSAEADAYEGRYPRLSGWLRAMYPLGRMEALVYEGNVLMNMLPRQDNFFGIDRSADPVRLSGLAFTGLGMQNWKPGKMPP